MTFVGEIMEVVEAQTNVMYKVTKHKSMVSYFSFTSSCLQVDDRTGPWIEVRKWLEEQVSRIRFVA